MTVTTRAERTRIGVVLDPATEKRWWALAVVLAAMFMAALDVAIVNIAAPSIQRELNVSDVGLVFVVSGYTLAYAMLLITGARLGDDHGHRRLFLAGLGCFTAASLVCGLAPNGLVLIIARVIQGGAGGMMVPQVLSIIQLRFVGVERARALGLYATVLAAGVIVGQIAGGALVTADLFGSAWRPVFLINVPAGVALLAAASRLLAPSQAASPRAPDYGGVVVLSTAVLLIVLPLILGQQQGWPPWTFASLLAGVALLGSTAAYLRHRTAHGRDALVDLAIFDSAGVRQGLVSLFAMTVAWGGFLFVITLYLQAGLGDSPLRSGLTFAPFAAGFALTSLSLDRLPAPAQRWTPPIGLIVLATGYAVLGVLDGSGGWHTDASAAILTVTGAGYGAAFSPMIAKTVARVPARLVPDASGMVGTTIQVAFVVGVAALGSYYLERPHTGVAASGSAFGHVAVASAGLAVIAAVFTGSPRVGGSSSGTDRRATSKACPAEIGRAGQPAGTQIQPHHVITEGRNA
jgi:MFS family permease